MKEFKQILGIFAGFALAAGAAWTWKFWSIHGVIAWLIAAAGVSLIFKCLGHEED